MAVGDYITGPVSSKHRTERARGESLMAGGFAGIDVGRPERPGEFAVGGLGAEDPFEGHEYRTQRAGALQNLRSRLRR